MLEILDRKLYFKRKIYSLVGIDIFLTGNVNYFLLFVRERLTPIVANIPFNIDVDTNSLCFVLLKLKLHSWQIKDCQIENYKCILKKHSWKLY